MSDGSPGNFSFITELKQTTMVILSYVVIIFIHFGLYSSVYSREFNSPYEKLEQSCNKRMCPRDSAQV